MSLAPSVRTPERTDLSIPIDKQNAARLAGEFIDQIGPYPGEYQGRGIVICAGGIKYLTCAWVLIKMLRRLGCQLPIQVWYLGEAEHDPYWIELVRPLGVECINAHQVQKTHPHRRLRGWESKAYAILHCPFREVLFLDADNVPVVDPTFLFETAEYLETGAVFWPDYTRTPASSSRWTIFGTPYCDEPEQESGQIVIDKQRCWKALNLCNWYNEHSDFFYRHVYGDKDTFLFAWRRCELRFSMPSKPPGVLPCTVLQYDFRGELLFQHRVHAKWSLVGNRRIQGYRYEAECLEYVAELQFCWNPIQKQLDRLSPGDRAQMRRLEGQRFRFVRRGHSRWNVRLAKDARILEGWTAACMYWWIKEDRLAFVAHDGKVSADLDADVAGVWSGREVVNRRVELQLAPA